MVNNDVITRKIHALPSKKRARTGDLDQIIIHQTDVSGHHQHHPVTPHPLSCSPATSQSKNDLSPCHICHRKPQRKSDLDAYKNCEGCGRRTCYICIRECNNWIQNPAPVVSLSGSNETADISFEMRDAYSGDDEHDEKTAATHDTHHQAASSSSSSSSPPSSSRTVFAEWWRHHSQHRTVICSQCCVETGPEGETMCLACLRFVDSGRGNAI